MELNRAVAVGMAEGPAAGLALVDALDSGALAYREAIELTGTTAERQYLARRLAEVS